MVILLSAWSGKKHLVESTPQKIIETSEIENDSIINRNKTIEPHSLEFKYEGNSVKNPDELTQVLSKRFIGTHELLSELLQKHVSENGNVDYKRFKNDRLKLYNYFKVLNLSFPNKSHSKEYTLAYWINAYNAMTIDLILRNYPIKSIKDIKNPWEQRYWKLGEKWYNLDEIEHQVLRKMDEPRIHFAIVCASYSCPKLQNEAFTSENLDQQLTKATKKFLNDSERNSITENDIELSKIFKWFSKDFEQNGSLIGFLNQYSDIQISDKAKKSFKDYNWDLNE